MKKLLTYIFTIIISFIATPVFADTVDCGALSEFTRPAAHLIMIAAPIILIVMSAFDILGAVTASDEKSMKKATNTIVKRFIICIVIFILPIIINMVIGWTTLKDLTACL